MAVATERRNVTRLAAGKGDGFNVKALVGTYSFAVATAAGQTADFGLIPSNARILGRSTVYWDDLTTTGSPTLDIGLKAVNGNITTDADALNDGLAVSSAGTGSPVIKDLANYGKRAWEFVSGQTSDPGGLLEVYASILDAGHTTAGDVTIEILYCLD